MTSHLSGSGAVEVVCPDCGGKKSHVAGEVCIRCDDTGTWLARLAPSPAGVARQGERVAASRTLSQCSKTGKLSAHEVADVMDWIDVSYPRAALPSGTMLDEVSAFGAERYTAPEGPWDAGEMVPLDEALGMLDDLAGDIGARHGDAAGQSVMAFRSRREHVLRLLALRSSPPSAREELVRQVGEAALAQRKAWLAYIRERTILGIAKVEDAVEELDATLRTLIEYDKANAFDATATAPSPDPEMPHG